MRAIWAMAVVAASLAGCVPERSSGELAGPASVTRTVPATPSAADGVELRWNVRPEGAAWTEMARRAVSRDGAALIRSRPADVTAFCPNYLSASDEARRDFWAGLISALSRWESNYRTEVSYEESFADSTGRKVVSRGLLQISQESANGYGCGISDPLELHDPETNISCAVRILDRRVSDAGRITSTSSPWRGAAAYWSPFRNAERRSDIQSWTAAQPFCN